MGTKYLVEGALCKCNYGSSTDKLIVKTQTRIYLNDKDGYKKAAASSADVGSTFEKNSFGSCSKQNNDPCNAVATEWSNIESQKIEEAGYFITEKSKVGCPIGGKDCISIMFHGQQAEADQENFKNVDPKNHAQINPWVDIENITEVSKKTLTLKAR